MQLLLPVSRRFGRSRTDMLLFQRMGERQDFTSHHAACAHRG